MKRNSVATIAFRRKREGKTDYRQRLKILSSRLPRLVIRKSLHNIQASIVEFEPKGDKVKVQAHSKQLKDMGWAYHTGSVPAAYLVGYLLGKRAQAAKLGAVVADIGLFKSVTGSKIYALLKGAVDAGLSVAHDEGMLPNEERVSGKHIAAYAVSLKGDDAAYKKQFSDYIKRNVDPAVIEQAWQQTKQKIDAA